jgi:hypothetical protein
MALYVWYEGKNLMENYHIQKGTIKTDEDLEIEEYEMEDALEAKATLDTNKFTMDDESEFAQDLEWVEEEVNKYKSAEEARTQDMYQNIEMRNKILAKHPELRSKIVAETGIDAIGDVHDEPGFVSLPMDMFGAVDPNDDPFFDDGMPKKKWRYTFNQEGVFKYLANHIGKKGNFVKTPKQEFKELVSNDPMNVMRFVFGENDVDPKWFNSVEALWKAIHSDAWPWGDEVLEKVESNDETTVQHIKEEVMKTWKRITGSE